MIWYSPRNEIVCYFRPNSKPGRSARSHSTASEWIWVQSPKHLLLWIEAFFSHQCGPSSFLQPFIACGFIFGRWTLSFSTFSNLEKRLAKFHFDQRFVILEAITANLDTSSEKQKSGDIADTKCRVSLLIVGSFLFRSPPLVFWSLSLVSMFENYNLRRSLKSDSCQSLTWY